MSKKVSELTKELGISYQELKEYADKLGIAISSARGSVEDKDLGRLTSTIEIMKGKSSLSAGGASKPKIKAVPIINRNAPKKAPVGQPVIPKNFEDRPHKAEKPAVEETPSEADVKEEAPNAEPVVAKPVAKSEEPDKKIAEKPVTEKKAVEVPEPKPETIEVKEEKTPEIQSEPVAEKKPEPKEEEYVNAPNKPMRFKKIVDANEVKKEEEARAKKLQAERKANEEKRGDRSSRDNKGRGKDGQDNRRNDKSRGDRSERGGDRNRDNRGRDNRDRQPRSKDDDDKRSSRPAQKRNTSGGASAAPAEGAKSKGKSKKFFDNKDRDKDKQGRGDRREDGNGGRNRHNNASFDERSLEKQARHKRKNKPKDEPEVSIEELLPEGTIAVSVPITVAGLAELAEISVTTIIMAMMKMGVMATINQTLDKDAVEMLAVDLGIDLVVTEEEEEIVEEGIDVHEDNEKDLKPRPPVITVMGHVDHGKTSLLDAIRKTNVTAGESGGITQHIGASEVMINGKKIVFLDTPGHEAFTTMRARGAQITDIAVLVVAADDGVMPQTVESISHAKAAGVPIIVAINKMDKPGANPDRVKQELTEHGILVEDWGGDVISVPVSAKKGEGITDLLEMILLQAEMLELKANPDRLASGTVIEARLDKAKGPIATLLVTNGTIKSGQSVVAGTCSGKIRVMTNFKGDEIRKAGPATAVEILGLGDVPMAGDSFNIVKDDKTAREIASARREKLREDVLAKNASTTLEKLFSQIQEGEAKELNLIIKADVQGSVGAIIGSLEKLDTPEVKVRVIHSGVGTVNESDVTLAETSNAIIIGFNVRPSTAVMNQAADADVEVRLYRVIYDILDDIQAAMKGMLDPEFKEEVLGKAEVRDTFKVPNVGIIAGAYVKEGIVKRNEQIRLVRDGIVIHEGTISSLKRFKDDAKEVAAGYECGIGIENYNDIKPDDIIECFTMVEIER